MLRRTWIAIRGAGWVLLLVGVAWPWRFLGGLVDERLRWWEWFVFWTSPAAGFVAGRSAREAVRRRGSPGAASLAVRLLHYPALMLAASALLWLEATGRPEVAGIVVTGWLGLAAGADLGWSLPLPDERTPARRPQDAR